MNKKYAVRINCDHTELCILMNALRSYREHSEGYYRVGNKNRLPTLSSIDRMMGVVQRRLEVADSELEAESPRP